MLIGREHFILIIFSSILVYVPILLAKKSHLATCCLATTGHSPETASKLS